MFTVDLQACMVRMLSLSEIGLNPIEM